MGRPTRRSPIEAGFRGDPWKTTVLSKQNGFCCFSGGHVDIPLPYVFWTITTGHLSAVSFHGGIGFPIGLSKAKSGTLQVTGFSAWTIASKSSASNSSTISPERKRMGVRMEVIRFVFGVEKKRRWVFLYHRLGQTL